MLLVMVKSVLAQAEREFPTYMPDSVQSISGQTTEQKFGHKVNQHHSKSIFIAYEQEFFFFFCYLKC